MIKISVSFNIASLKVCSKVCLSNINRILRKEVLKPRYIDNCNLIHKALQIPYVKVDIYKPTNNQSFALSPNVIGTSCLNACKQPSPTNIRKPSPSATKLSHLNAYKSAHQNLHHDRCVKTDIVFKNHLGCKQNQLWWKIF